MLRPEAINQKMFRRLTKEKATLSRKIDKGKNVNNCWNFIWLRESVLVRVSWEGKTVEHSMRVDSYIEKSDTVLIRSVTVHLARRAVQDCVVYCLLPSTLVYCAVLQPGLFSVYCLIYCTTTRTTFSELPQALC